MKIKLEINQTKWISEYLIMNSIFVLWINFLNYSPKKNHYLLSEVGPRNFTFFTRPSDLYSNEVSATKFFFYQQNDSHGAQNCSWSSYSELIFYLLVIHDLKWTICDTICAKSFNKSSSAFRSSSFSSIFWARNDELLNTSIKIIISEKLNSQQLHRKIHWFSARSVLIFLSNEMRKSLSNKIYFLLYLWLTFYVFFMLKLLSAPAMFRH